MVEYTLSFPSTEWTRKKYHYWYLQVPLPLFIIILKLQITDK